jgi:hypothetical protein
MSDQDCSRHVDAKRAVAVASEYLASRGHGELPIEGLKAIDGDTDKWPFRPPEGAYGAPEGFPAGCWVVYVRRLQIMIRSSEIVGISKDDGQVVFYGDAGDEG